MPSKIVECLLSTTNELHRHPGQTIRLGQHGYGGLREYLAADEFGHFCGNIYVGYARFSCLQVLGLDREVGHGILQPILECAEVGSDVVLVDDGFIDGVKTLLGARLRRDAYYRMVDAGPDAIGTKGPNRHS